MANLDRPAIIELLGRFAAEDDATVLAAARELHRTVSGSGLTWNEVLRADLNVASANGDQSSEAGSDDLSGDHRPTGESSAADKSEAARLIDRLLARKTISSALREELAELKRTAAEGSLDAMDQRYIRALAKRLGS